MRIRQVPGPPTVALRAWLTGGARAESVPGEALVAARMLTEGTRRRRWRRIAREAEERGQVIEAFGGAEMTCLAIDALARDLERALDDLVEMVLEPAWPAARFHLIQRQTAAELESLLDLPDARTGRAFLEALYGEHPYGRPLHGTLAALRSLEPAACAHCHRRALGRGLLVTIAGAVDEDAARRAVERRLPLGELDLAGLPPVAAPPAPVAGHVRVRLPPGEQAHVVCGRLTVPRAHPDRTALELIGVALGAGTGVRGRLADRIREREGLAYEVEVACAAGAGLDAGRFAVYAATAPRRADRLEAAVRDELTRLVADGLEPEELDEARDYLVGSAPFRVETARQIADRLAEEALYGPSVAPAAREAAWRTVTADHARVAAQHHLDPSSLLVAIGRPP